MTDVFLKGIFVNKRSILKAATGCAGYFLGCTVYGSDMKKSRKVIQVKGFDAVFSAVIEENVEVKQVRDYDGNGGYILELRGKSSEFADFPILVSCFAVEVHADALSIGFALAGFWGGRNIDFDGKYSNFSRAFVGYEKYDISGGRNVRMYVFKNGNKLVVLRFPYGVDDNQVAAMGEYEDDFRASFQFEGAVDNKKGIPLKSLDGIGDILLPSDWNFHEVAKKITEKYDPKGTMTRGYLFEHKDRPKNDVPNIFLAHYNDNVEDGRYLLEWYKDKIVEQFKLAGSKVVFDHVEILPGRMKDEKIFEQKLIMRLRDSRLQSLPLLVRVTLFSGPAKKGSYLMYSIGANVSDGRIYEYSNDELIKKAKVIQEWLMLDIAGSSMEWLLYEVLREGKVNYPRLFGL